MRFTLSWLKQFLETNASIEEIANSLTMLGLEVEEITNKATELAGFEVAEIIAANPHPEADKLQICKVKTLSGILDIVCGAPNARAGIKVVLAKIGTIIPKGNFKIKQSKIRGIDSYGMLCSADELNIKGDSTGIIEIIEEAHIGDNIAKYLGLNDPVIEIDITANRADALGVYGIARDLAAAGMGKLKELIIPKIQAEFTSNIELSVTYSGACPLFAIREIKNIINKESPKWLKEQLENIGVGSISAIVDITNYISYSFGQPMHAYDANKIGKNLIIETLATEQNFLALNDKEYKLVQEDIVIRDEKEIHCLAGIIGGKNSACTETTNRIILEAACFNSKYIAKTGRRLMINSDSRYRFERNVDREFTLKALDYATNLILTICSGEASEVQMHGSTSLPTKIIEFPVDFLTSRAGFTLESNKITNILGKLGFKCEDKNNNIKIEVPSWRADISIKEDIVEEVVRIYGYDKIPLSPLPEMSISNIIDRRQRRLMDLKRLVAATGYTEVVTWSFMDSKKANLFSEFKAELMLQNPISSDLNYMRSSILPNLLSIACNNINRSYKDLSFFELGPIFRDADNIQPIISLAGIRTGSNILRNCHIASRNFDVFDIKSDLEAIFALIGLELDKCQIKSQAPSYYHPTRSATIMLGKNIIGYFGQIHPNILKSFEIDIDVMAFEIDVFQLPMSKEKFGKKGDYKVSDYQMVTRDYAFIIDDSQPIGEILNFIKNIDKSMIQNVNLFDIYSGDKIEKGKKSIAISVTIQDNNKTLTEEDIDNISKIIITSMKTKFNAFLRES